MKSFDEYLTISNGSRLKSFRSNKDWELRNNIRSRGSVLMISPLSNQSPTGVIIVWEFIACLFSLDRAVR